MQISYNLLSDYFNDDKLYYNAPEKSDNRSFSFSTTRKRKYGEQSNE